MDIQKIQEYLSEHEIDGWLLADFHARNEIAVALLGLSGLITRRSFFFIPAEGDPVALVNPIEESKFRHLTGARIIPCKGYAALESELKQVLDGSTRIAMEYSPMGRLPYIGLVDAGTVELIRGFGVEIVSSADLVANFQARLSVEQIAQHRVAAHNLIEIKTAAFAFVSAALRENRSVTEYQVVAFIMNKFTEYDMVTEHLVNCSVGAHAGDPHYEPDPNSSWPIERGQILLLDIWARLNLPGAPMADITWMGFTGTENEIPTKYQDIFAVLTQARDKAVAYIRENIERKPVHGYEVDDICRHVIKTAGFGDYFTHRTGHSITDSVHGVGPNIDNLETEDQRRLQRGHLFSIEPGIYMKDCGFRTEIDCLIGHEGAEVTTLPLQTSITPLL
jgi:Xaa-Pro dipeptidase